MPSTASVFITGGAAKEAVTEAELDPLSPEFEERTFIPQLQSPPLTHQVTATGWQSTSAAYAHEGFDPLTCTPEEFDLLHSPDNNEQVRQQPLSLPDAQQQAAGSAVTVAAANARKTRSIPRIFRLRKAGTASNSPAGTVSSPDADMLPAETTAPVTETDEEVHSITEGPAEQTAAVPKARSRPFNRLRKRGKGSVDTATPVLSQQQLTADSAAGDAAAQEPTWSQSAVGPSPEDEQQGSDVTAEQPQAKQDLRQVVHANTRVGLLAGLPASFDSFMAIKSPGAASDSPHQLLTHRPYIGQSTSNQVDSLCIACCVLSMHFWADLLTCRGKVREVTVSAVAGLAYSLQTSSSTAGQLHVLLARHDAVP